MEKITVGISKCLLGEKVRYDGQHKHDRYITGTLGKFFDWVGYCPEADSGLSIPRPAMRLVGTVPSHRLLTVNTAEDKTAVLQDWIDKVIPTIPAEGLCGYIFKAKSPSSGMKGVKIYAENGSVVGTGSGLFAERFMQEFPLVPVIDEGRLHDVGLRENFLEHVFVYARWQQLLKDGITVAGLQLFHQRHKYILMSHSPARLKEMGKLVAQVSRDSLGIACKDYLLLLTAAMRELATVKKQRNVLEHIAGYFKDDLDKEEKAELIELIDKFYNELTPLIVPVTMLSHYVRKYRKDYLADQYYINALPAELMLRNYI